MKTLLAILLSFAVTEGPVLAIHGGYTLGGQDAVVGSYAGVLIPESSSALLSGTANTVSQFGSDALGIFTLSVPDTGIGSGSVLIFSGEEQLNGTIQVLADPTNVGGIIGVISAQDYVTEFNDAIAGGTVEQIQTLIANAGGELQAVVSNAGITTNSPTGVNLTGTANVTFSVNNNTASAYYFFFGGTNLENAEQVSFAVDGYQQSSVPGVSTSLSGT